MSDNSDDFLKKFGQMIKIRRKEKNVSQVQAAHDMKIDYRHYQNLERGKVNFRADMLLKLLNYYDLGVQISPAKPIQEAHGAQV